VYGERIKEIKQYCEQQNLPLIEEYDFRRDKTTKDLQIEIKSTTVIRDYQEQSLSKMFSNGRARSGIIVLPCGAGKTLTGILAASHIKKSTLVLCNTNVSMEQWRKQFCQWAALAKLPVRFSSKENKDIMFDGSKEAGIVISTYGKVAISGKKAYGDYELFDRIRDIDWGLVILDEVQVVPA
jgi:DNA excision repair protein ERCC-3